MSTLEELLAIGRDVYLPVYRPREMILERGQGTRLWDSAGREYIDFGAGEKLAVGIPWGDVSTAYYSTGIGNIEVYTASSQKAVDRMRRANLFRPLLQQRWIRELVKLSAQRRVIPPDKTQRDNNPAHVWGEVRNAAGEVKTARVRTANGYSFTVHSSLAIVSEILSRPCNPGFTTPSSLMGADFVSTLPGSSTIRLDP